MTRWTVRRAADPPAAAVDHEFVLDDSLGYLVNRVARLFAARLAEELRPAGVGIGQWAVLLVLWAGDGTSQAELARQVAIEPPTLVRTLDRMERDGLVERRVDQRDARRTRIWLTERGWALRDELVPRAAAVNEAADRLMTRHEAETLRGLLRRLLLTAHEGERPEA